MDRRHHNAGRGGGVWVYGCAWVMMPSCHTTEGDGGYNHDVSVPRPLITPSHLPAAAPVGLDAPPGAALGGVLPHTGGPVW